MGKTIHHWCDKHSIWLNKQCAAQGTRYRIGYVMFVKKMDCLFWNVCVCSECLSWYTPHLVVQKQTSDQKQTFHSTFPGQTKTNISDTGICLSVFVENHRNVCKKCRNVCDYRKYIYIYIYIYIHTYTHTYIYTYIYIYIYIQ